MKAPVKIHKNFSRRLLRWYKVHQRPLPWRNTKDPYAIWISEVMLQQTTVRAVIPYFKQWMDIFPDMKALAESSLQKVLKAWQGLGYYQRARNLHTAARIIQKRHRGRIPDTYESLLKLPGFGPYTTAAVLSLAFDEPYPVIEANVRRVLMRIGGLKKEASPRYDPILLDLLVSILPTEDIGLFNQAMMELGALICRPKNPSCLICPVHMSCRAYSSGQQEVIPKPSRRNYRRIEAVIGIIRDKNRYLIQKRPSHGLLADLWEFPGGKIRPGETRIQALKRELKEELGSTVVSMKYLTSVQHAYTQYQVTLHAFESRLKEPPEIKNKTLRWVSLKGIQNYPLPSGSVKIVRFLENQQKNPIKARKQL